MTSLFSSRTLQRQRPISEDPLLGLGTGAESIADTNNADTIADNAADASTEDGRHIPQYPLDYDQIRTPLTRQQIIEQDNIDMDNSSNWSDIIVDPADDGDDDDDYDDDGSAADIDNNSNNNSLWARWRRRRPNSSSSSGSRRRRQQQQQRRRRRSSSTIKLQVPCILCDCAIFFYDWTFAAIEIWMEVLIAPPFPVETLQKVSIILLAVEIIRDSIDHEALLAMATIPTTTAASGGDSNQYPLGIAFAANGGGMTYNFGHGPMTLASIPHYLIWGVPLALAMVSISFVFTLQIAWGHQEEAVIATALILLIFLEALLPLFILGCTSLFLFQQVSWETGLALLVIVWVGSTFTAHCIRRMLYQSLGHG